MSYKRIATVTCLTFYALLGVALLQVDYAAIPPIALAVSIPLALFLADFLSGLVHVFLDYYPINGKAGFDRMYVYSGKRNSDEFKALRRAVYAHPDARLIDHLAYSFKIHHDRPRAMNRKIYPVHVFETVIPASVVVLLSFAAPPAIAFTLAVAGFLVANVQFIHACVHDTPRSRVWKPVIHRLQRWHVMYSARTHGIHHREGVSNFCLVTGWANPLLNPLFRLMLHVGIANRYHWAPPGAPLPQPGTLDD